jgi:hypothetical protein
LRPRDVVRTSGVDAGCKAAAGAALPPDASIRQMPFDLILRTHFEEDNRS